jgi:hypothetical protein
LGISPTDDSSRSWKFDLVIQHFHPNDVPKILSIPLRDPSEDFISWHFDNRNLFSVKSAYKVHVEMLKRDETTQVGQGSESPSVKLEVFQKLWKFRCPPKVQHFLGRLAHNSHPLYMNIVRRGVELDTRCVVCHIFCEDGGHLFSQLQVCKEDAAKSAPRGCRPKTTSMSVIN